MDYHIRPGTPGDSDQMLETLADAFAYALSPDSPAAQRIREDVMQAPEAYRVMISNGRLISLLRIVATPIQVGRCVVLKADVGHVAVRPQLQGRGIGTTLMQETVRWLRGEGYHLSRLGGLTKFYSRFGYEPFVRRFVEFPVREKHGGARKIPPVEAYPAPTGFEGRLRPFDEARDYEARARLAHSFYMGRSGASPISLPDGPPVSPSPADPEALDFVYELGGDMKGFLLARHDPHESSEHEIAYSVSDFAYAPEYPQAAGLLFQQLFARVAPHAPARIISRLPYDEQLAAALQQWGIGFDRREMHQAVAANMIQVLNLPKILLDVAPELTGRMADSPLADWCGTLRFELPAQTAELALPGGDVAPGDDAKAEFVLNMSQSEFVKLLFGIISFEESICVREGHLDAGQRAVASTLFPRCATGSGPWG